ncbi:hypothetical protein L211DRAFT_835338 [Terfezia boudieri ATCC MYA-4762]|uniref:EGF-like domain-containing protein n=1 Tax=Terfezia boudieri ATCC MYA-4762 TaxID=1051890 RepID=A0A3N4LUD9_9PEZI|nr:hypothetical protein L211DRAFT_835338 [Terfezia boudieri ATCC MYA-4762]
MKLSLSVALMINATFFIRIGAGLSCDSSCAACWKDGVSGVDTKFSCDDNGHCGNTCPPGYHGMHCARASRCSCYIGTPCGDFGPCFYGKKYYNQIVYCSQKT